MLELNPWALEHATQEFCGQARNEQPIIGPECSSGPSKVIWQVAYVSRSRPGHPFSVGYVKLEELNVGELMLVVQVCGTSIVIASVREPLPNGGAARLRRDVCGE